MLADSVGSAAPTADAALSLEERLERCEIVYFPRCPFPLPDGDDRSFLLEQQLGTTSKNISYNPHDQRARGFQRCGAAQSTRLRELLAAFSKNASAWLSQALPHYSRAWRLDRVSFRTVEEATRHLRPNARNDLLHLDAFPSRPTGGRRILRCFANINPSEPRVWITSDSFARLLDRYGADVGLGGSAVGVTGWLQDRLLQVFQPNQPRRTAYDAFMLRFHAFLKANEEFQEKSGKRCWAFPPGSAWVLFGDAVSHAELRGRFALEHSYFVPCEALLHPELAPLALLQRASGQPVARAG